MIMFIAVVCGPFYIFGVEYEPWGPDADLVTSSSHKESIIRQIAGFDAIIAFHHQILTKADGPRSHYYPSSSTYMLQATRKYGLVRGFPIGCDRLLRENNDPWIYPPFRTKDGDYLKSDPVP
jgi:putative component of membrane protein insertase Oxa1/YidC/SpoIIIJ protein YidD